ncbi:MAG: DUF3105 domain-containing protein [Chloroflexota bacterium]|nr:DUF3105 domain-containing protein [Chloroflexota bacterium]
MSSRPSRPSSSSTRERSTRPTPRSTRETTLRGRQVRSRRSKLWIWGPVALILGALLVGGAWMLLNRPALDGVQTFSNSTLLPDPNLNHTEGPVTYAQIPPAGGPHNPVQQNCGIYDQPVRNENAVHSLEHGAVWITYRPDLPAADVERLRSLARGHSHVLLSPYPELPAPVVASAWGVQLKVDSASDPRLALFIDRYERVGGPETPEVGATCRGGIGTPVER